ncbi:hypothetical protein CANINC_001541 [Pichia inconspicua]|uniref:ERAD-associated E3 ubiquitin-protein ligase component HRD3 n=1 Tax=Pichia inconspicua TaxID=52247 RepID=A0A4T0X4Q4_9ASCO|nr:hypothetical protein CANINC_001541 [[Candida] inconspicua]
MSLSAVFLTAVWVLSCRAEYADDLLYEIRNSQDLSKDKYFYTVPDDYIEKPFMNYFNYIRKEKNYTRDAFNGYEITLPDERTFFFEEKDLDEYGAVGFNLPIGELPQIESDVFDKVKSPDTDTIDKLEKLADNGDLLAMKYAADIHTMGLFDIKVDIDRAFHLYTKLTQSEDTSLQSHANFMLGVFYTTGLFSKFPKDPAKGLIHYQFASNLGSIQAQKALAHKYMYGINVAKDIDQAIYYFSLARQQSSLKDIDDFTIPHIDSFSIRWSDLNDGIYGKEASQYVSTIRYFERFEDYNEIKKYKNPNAISDDAVHDYVVGEDDVLDGFSILYFHVQKNYHGDYLHARNFKKSFEYAKICVENGILEPEVERFYAQVKDGIEGTTTQSQFSFITDPQISPMTIFVGRCAQYLSHMYLTGDGGELDNDKAYFYAKLGKAMTNSQTFLNDIAIMQYKGIGTANNTELALATLRSTYRYASSRYFTSLISIKEAGGVLDQNTISGLTTSASHYLLSANKIIELYEEGEDLGLPAESIARYYNMVLQHAESDYFDFRIPFFAFINAQKNDVSSNKMWTALTGMAIISELGYESAQSSLGYILYPLIQSSKVSVNDLQTLESQIYTPKRYDEAIYYTELSVLHSNRDSINFLGDMYYAGLYRGTPNDDPLWCKSWIHYVFPVAKVEEMKENPIVKLIQLIESLFRTKKNGFDVTAIIPRDIDRAITYYRDSASKGSHMGCFNIGWAYEYGIGVAQDLHLAKRYYDEALLLTTDAYVPVRIAVIRIKLKAWLWQLYGLDGRGLGESQSKTNSWKERMSLIKSWFFTTDHKL